MRSPIHVKRSVLEIIQIPPQVFGLDVFGAQIAPADPTIDSPSAKVSIFLLDIQSQIVKLSIGLQSGGLIGREIVSE